ncbi:glycosyltransferase family 4 protein [Thermococcus sp. LS2]|uniref:glycosyltransferase family 4 protein n=1 Tax=Thermococcus sp. LS2 TaxID=1638260 RepID=UPI00143C6414|nr:glycosyltransferase family 4 protein [Thermococcus sp. LS2]NJE12860.1 glycosyltransferase [Thermococcus sp. LS2]
MLKLLVIIGKEKGSENNAGFQEYLAEYLSNSFDVDIDVLTFSSKSLAYRAIIIVKHTLKLLPRVNNYDIIFSTSFLTVALLAFIKKLAHRRFKPVLITIDIGTLRIRDFFARILFHVLDLDKRICLSRIQKRKLIQVMRVSEKRVMFVPLGLQVQEDSKRLSKITTKKYIFSAGRYGRDFGTLISAIEDLRIPTVLVMGKDPFRDKSLQEIPSLPNVTIYYEIPYEEYLSLLRSSTFVVLPLRYTQYPIGQTVLLDAMANGKAIIVTSIPAILDYVAGNFKDVVLVKPYDTEELRKHIEYLIENPKYIRKLEHVSRQRFSRKFTSFEMAKRIKEVLER